MSSDNRWHQTKKTSTATGGHARGLSKESIANAKPTKKKRSSSRRERRRYKKCKNRYPTLNDPDVSNSRQSVWPRGQDIPNKSAPRSDASHNMGHDHGYIRQGGISQRHKTPKLLQNPARKNWVPKFNQGNSYVTAYVPELGTSAKIEDISGDSGDSNVIEREITQQNLYKTELCKPFERSGTCRYGAKCQFAHGQAELRPVMRHPKYKTEVCKSFQTTGKCRYGSRCRFIHEPVFPEIPHSAAFVPRPTPAPLLWKGAIEKKQYQSSRIRDPPPGYEGIDMSTTLWSAVPNEWGLQASTLPPQSWRSDTIPTSSSPLDLSSLAQSIQEVAESVIASPEPERKRRRGSSSAARLPVFQRLSIGEEEEITHAESDSIGTESS